MLVWEVTEFVKLGGDLSHFVLQEGFPSICRPNRCAQQLEPIFLDFGKADSGALALVELERGVLLVKEVEALCQGGVVQ